MTHPEFKKQFERLVVEYGDKAYGPEKALLIWNGVQNFSVTWFAGTISNLIASERYAPLPAKFLEFAAEERERLYEIEKAQNRKNAEEGWGSLTNEEIKQVTGGLKQRIAGDMDDNAFAAFQRALQLFANRKA